MAKADATAAPAARLLELDKGRRASAWERSSSRAPLPCVELARLSSTSSPDYSDAAASEQKNLKKVYCFKKKNLKKAQPPSFAPPPTAYIRTNFTILEHNSCHILMLGLGNRHAELKAAVFVIDSATMKAAADAAGLQVPTSASASSVTLRAPLETACFQFRKGCVMFYVDAVRAASVHGFAARWSQRGRG